MIPLRVLLLWLICISLIGVRLSGAHLHICLDGQEAPRSIQTELHYDAGETDGPIMAAHESANDIEIDLLGSALHADPVKGKLTLPLLAFVVSAFLLLLIRPRSFLLPLIERSDGRPQRPPGFSPPLRGPPVFSVV